MSKIEALAKQVVIVCKKCGNELEGDELENPSLNGDEVICDECYNELYCIYCCICGEIYPKEEMQQFVLNESIHDLYGIGGELQVGFYKVTELPYLLFNILTGVEAIYMDCVEFIGKPNKEYFEEFKDGGGEGECCKKCMEDMIMQANKKKELEEKL